MLQSKEVVKIIAGMFAFIAAHLERIADYATNICEETVFSMEGEIAME